MKEGNPHAGHRGRMRNRFLQGGLDQFEKHNALELLLFHAVPRGDTNETAHRLLDTFGSLSGVFDAPFEALCAVKGVGETTAMLLKLVPAMGRLYLDDKNTVGTRICSTRECGLFLLPKFVGEMSECVLLLCLDSKNKVLGCPLVCRGDVVSVNVTPRRVVELALQFTAASVVLSHNHPRGLALPSREDIDTTLQMREALKLVGVELVDHIIVADGEFVSLADSGVFYGRQ